MSTAEPHRPRWPRPSRWPVWVVPLLLLPFQIGGSFGAQHGGGPGGHGPWDSGGQGPWDSGRPAGSHRDRPPCEPLDAFGVLLLIAGPALLLFRRRYPRATLAGVGAVTVVYFLHGYVYGPVFLSAVVALVAAVVAGHRLAAWAGTSATIAVYLALTALFGQNVRGHGSGLIQAEKPDWGGTMMVIGWALVTLTAAELIRLRSVRLAEAARTRAEEARRQASEERLRMARELHDVLAHNISMINVQAGVALHLMDDDPQQARTALAAIKDASKEALSEMRSVIGVLRSDGETAPRSPTAGLDRLEELLERARTAGLPVDAQIEGERRPIPAGADLAAYRIVQESLTNVTRHAGTGPVTATVRIAYGDRDIAVQVDDDGRGVSLLDDHPEGTGSGIRGMRERATALGGRFEAGPRPGGGFRVTATLPIDGSSP
ncbi:sensor histidine kinase [Actinomadura barringtoniae]|uniref:histidine kinase n=1 Tax=Actinomadura barringtoniae TaxID=1427535 RepID=A0A939T9S2_9ACTN|nr:sensor histidine kinase [Actinomadura barringtoniae]MBO2448270.1 sensor histidine kinase [Actinomadura barringtoniae]